MAKIQQKQIIGSGGSGGLSIVTDILTVTNTDNGIETISTVPSMAMFILFVNGVAYMPFGTNPPFTISTNTLLWNTTNAGFSLMSTDSVVAVYTA